jgi:sortase B
MMPRRPVQHYEREPRNSLPGSQFRRKESRRRKKLRRYSFKRRHRIGWRRFLPMLILVAILLYATVSLVRYKIRSVSTKQVNEELQEMYEQAAETPNPETPTMAPAPTPTSTLEPTATPKPALLSSYQYIGDTILPEAEEMLRKNPDTVAWIHIPGGVVNLPIVYRNNTYYFNHDFYGKRNDSGTLFLDEAHHLAHDTQYMVVHGHNMHDGSMFGLVSYYRKRGYMEKHPMVYLNTLYQKEEYEVIGVLYLPIDVQSEGYVAYTGTRKFWSLDQFYSFATNIRKNALYWKDGAEMLPSDAFLALSTCYKGHRIVVMCRRTSP